MVEADGAGGLRWVDKPSGGSGGIPEAPIDGKQYGREDAAWTEVDTNSFSGSHQDLTDVLTDDHHTKYTDQEAIAAVGPHFSGDHNDLTDVQADQHHARYTDPEAITAMGPEGEANPLNHERYTDAEAVSAVGPIPPPQTYLHEDLTDVTADQHHTRYTDQEAIDAVGDPGAGVYLPLAGGTMSGVIDMGANQIKSVLDPTDPQDAVTKVYVDGLITEPNLHVESEHTGLYDGGEITWVGTAVTVAAGTGLIVDSYTDPHNPVATPVTWVEQTVDPGAILTRGRTAVWIDSAGTVQYGSTWPSGAKRTSILVGYVYHDYAEGGAILGQNRVAYPTNNLGLSFWDFVSATQTFPILVDGSGYIEANTDLTFGITEQRWWGPMVNSEVSLTDPNFKTVPAANPTSIYYVDQEGAVITSAPGGSPTTLVDPERYESAPGIISNIPGGGNRSSIQRLYLTLAGNTIMCYGQQWYGNLEEAITNLNQDIAAHVTPDQLSLATLVAYFVMENSANDLADGTDVVIIDTDGIPISGGATAAHEHDATYLRLDGTNTPMLGAIDMGGYGLTSVLDPVLDQDAATKKYVDDGLGAIPPPFSGDHDDLSNVTASQHHVRYSDAEAVAAVGPIPPAQTFLHADLTDVTADQHHTKYTDAEAVAAVGPVGVSDHDLLTNVTASQHHIRYTDAEAVAAVGPVGVSDHSLLTNVQTDDHHARYEDDEARAANPPDLHHFIQPTAPTTPVLGDVWVNPDEPAEGVYLPLTGGTLTGSLTIQAADNEAALILDRTDSGRLWRMVGYSSGRLAFQSSDNLGVDWAIAPLQMEPTEAIWKVPQKAPNGGVATPPYSFEGSPTAGMYVSSGFPRISAEGVFCAQFSGGGVKAGDGTLSSGGLAFQAAGSTGISRISTHLVLHRAGSERMRIESNGMWSYGQQQAFPNLTTTGNSGSLWWQSSTGRMFVSTSARKGKKDIVEVPHLADYKLTPVGWTSKHEDDNEKRFYGFIADDMPDERMIVRDIYDEVENYDMQAVIAVLAAKVNRLEAQLNG